MIVAPSLSSTEKGQARRRALVPRLQPRRRTETEPTCAKPRVAAIAPTPPARSSTANFHQEELASGMKLA